VKGKEEEEELEGKATVDGGRRYTTTQTGAGRPDRSFVTGGQTKRNSWNSRRTVYTISKQNLALCSKIAEWWGSMPLDAATWRTRAAEVMDE
jgi:hypothetical protein